MDRVTRVVDGKRLTTLPKAILAGIERSLNSFDFEEKVDIKTESDDINVNMIRGKKLLDELKAALDAKIKNEEEILR